MEIAIVCSLGILNQLRRMRSTDHGTDTMMTFVNPLRPKVKTRGVHIMALSKKVEEYLLEAQGNIRNALACAST